MIDQVMAMQAQLAKVPDMNLRQALSQPNQAMPQFLLMMEMQRRNKIRASAPQGPVSPQNMREEMASGIYAPVPQPPIVLPPVEDMMNSGIMSGMGGTPQSPSGANPTVPLTGGMNKGFA